MKLIETDGRRGEETDWNSSPLPVEVSNSSRVEIETNGLEEAVSEF